MPKAESLNPFDRFSRRRMSPAYWLVLSLVCLAIDYRSGPDIQFPVAYLVPISLAAWFGGRVWGIGLAFVLPFCRLYFTTVWDPPATFVASSINAVIRIAVFASFAWLLDRTARQMRELRHLHLLEGMLGVCSVCKNIRDERQDAWQSLDSYVRAHPAEFRPDVCPQCAGEMRDVFDRR